MSWYRLYNYTPQNSNIGVLGNSTGSNSQTGNEINISQSNPMSSNSTTSPYGTSVPDSSRVEEVSGENGTMATTQFIDDGAVVSNDVSHVLRPSDTLYSLNDSMIYEQSVLDFLAKPIVLYSGAFATTDTYSLLNSYAMPYAIFTSSQALLWRQKLAGYYGLRFDMIFKLVVNANRFQQGRYIMSYTSIAGAAYDGVRSPLFNSNMRLPTLVQRTTVPHVEIDLNTDTTAELVVPWSSVRNFYEMEEVWSATQRTNLGFLNIYPYYPLTTASGSLTASYTVYVSLANVSLVGAASFQSGLPAREVTNKANGPISGPLSAVSRGFKEFESIPLLSSYASSISWVSDRLARTACMFGFSKPTQGDSLTKFVPLSSGNHSNVDGDSDARSLALLARPGVVNLTGLGGTDYDEMDFSYIGRKYAWFKTQPWVLADTVGQLFNIPVGPYSALTVGSAVNHTPVSFIANNFKFWRGSLRYKFKFVKTEFHSGRLSFSFFPFRDPAAPNFNSDYYVHRWIVDIRENNEIEIVVPYISASMYTGFLSSIGRLQISVVDPLIAPATVTGSITILCEIAAGDDFEVAVPGGAMSPTLVVPQSGLPSAYNIMTGTIGSSKVEANPTLASSVSMGDKVSSFRPLLKRFYMMRQNTSVSASTILLNSPGVGVVTDYIPILPLAPATPYFTSDLVATIASCYSMWRGGVRIRDVLSRGMLNTTKNASPIVAVLNTDDLGSYSVPIVKSGTAASFAPVSQNFSRVYQEVDKNAIVTLEVPQYSEHLARATQDCFSLGTTAAFNYNSFSTFATSTGNIVYINAPAGVSASITPVDGYQLHNVHRALADDGNFMGFVSIPPMILNSVYDPGWNQGLY